MPDNVNNLVPLDAQREPAGCKEPLFGLGSEALSAWVRQFNEPIWRGKQLAEAIYKQRYVELNEITTLPILLRRQLAAEGWRIGRPGIVQTFQSIDGTERYLIELSGPGQKGQTVETVWMPEGDGGEGEEEGAEQQPGDASPIPRAAGFERVGEQPAPCDVFPSFRDHSGERARDARLWSRATICISSQVGCAVNCQFCLTAKLGLQRNLSAGEIAGQVVAVLDRHQVRVGGDRVNVVFMGMGEPFLNYDNFMAAVGLLVNEVGLSPRRMTVSTSGIVPGIERFAQEPPEIRPRLAISLNAPNDRIRAEVMPINRKWPIDAVVDAVRRVALRPRERITFEYVLLAGVTDRPDDAREVARLVRRSGFPAKVNLIAWNPGPGIAYATPAAESVLEFQKILVGEGIAAFIRQPRGRDIFAACGQLKRTVDGPAVSPS